MKPEPLGNAFFEISEMTNIRNLFSPSQTRYLLYWKPQKILGERIEPLMNKRN
jgi:hypothetical protein